MDKVRKSPPVLRKALKALYYNLPDKYRYGRSYNKNYDLLQKTQFLSKEKIDDYQLKQLKNLINHAYERVPYYKRIFKERELTPLDIKEFQDLKKLPYLTKDIIRNNFKELIAVNYNEKDLRQLTTGGTTGMPISFLAVKNFYTKEWSFMTALWKRVGYNNSKTNRMVILRGQIPHKGYYEYCGKNLILSSFLLSNRNFMEYIDRIVKFNPDFIQAYPSSITVLSKYILENNIKIVLPKLKAILCGSENLYEFQRGYIKKAFNTKLFSWYGHSELCCLAGECEVSSAYHLVSEYGYTELINKEGREAVLEGELGEIVATGFSNYVMPFIRYRTGDIAVNTNESCSCGRNYKLIKKINGREQEFFVDKTDSKITFTCSDDAFWRVHDRVEAYQYIQNEPGKVILNIEVNSRFQSEDEDKIIFGFHEYFPTLDITIRIVEEIPKTSSGKFRFLIQNLKNSGALFI
jgi:phenylacetate-CoA ligase